LIGPRKPVRGPHASYALVSIRQIAWVFPVLVCPRPTAPSFKVFPVISVCLPRPCAPPSLFFFLSFHSPGRAFFIHHPLEPRPRFLSPGDIVTPPPPLLTMEGSVWDPAASQLARNICLAQGPCG